MAYFDNNATTPPREVALRAHEVALREDWRNPSSPTIFAARVRAKLEKTREELAAFLGCAAGSLCFTSGATEANNAVFAQLARKATNDQRVLLSPMEHPSVREAANRHFPGRVKQLSVNGSGVVSSQEASQTLTDGSYVAVSVMAANNETGVLQPWSELASLCTERGVAYHCDATQWIGKLPIDGLPECDYLTASAHKFGGLRGIGFLKAPEDFSFIVGGEQESGRRAGTENYPGIASMLAALRESLENDQARVLEKARNAFEQKLLESFSGIRIVGAEVNRLWNTSSLLMPDFDNLRWVGKLEKLGHEISTGSACSSGIENESSVAVALGLTVVEARRIVRVSGSFDTLPGDWEDLAEAFLLAHQELSAGSGSLEVVSV